MSEPERDLDEYSEQIPHGSTAELAGPRMQPADAGQVAAGPAHMTSAAGRGEGPETMPRPPAEASQTAAPAARQSAGHSLPPAPVQASQHAAVAPGGGVAAGIGVAARSHAGGCAEAADAPAASAAAACTARTVSAAFLQMPACLTGVLLLVRHSPLRMPACLVMPYNTHDTPVANRLADHGHCPATEGHATVCLLVC